MSVPSSELGPPYPSPASSCVPPPDQRREGTHSPAVEGVEGGFLFGRIKKKPTTLSTLWLPCTILKCCSSSSHCITASALLPWGLVMFIETHFLNLLNTPTFIHDLKMLTHRKAHQLQDTNPKREKCQNCDETHKEFINIFRLFGFYGLFIVCYSYYWFATAGSTCPISKYTVNCPPPPLIWRTH